MSLSGSSEISPKKMSSTLSIALGLTCEVAIFSNRFREANNGFKGKMDGLMQVFRLRSMLFKNDSNKSSS
jgi:hypothetical protein